MCFMKWSSFAYFVLISIALSSCKKDLLHWQNIQMLNSNTTSRLNKIKFVDNNTCIIGGGEKFLQAEVIISTDGGYTWTSNSFLTIGKGMYGLGVSPGGRVYLSGFDAKVIYSPDKGLHWQTGYVSEYAYYVGVSFPSENVGYMVSTIGQDSGTIVRVDSNLITSYVKKYKAGLNDISMADPQTGYVIGYGIVLKTSDSGNSWSYADITGNDNYTGIDVHNENDVWLCGYSGGIFHTVDGISWNWVRNGNDFILPKYHLLAIAFKNDNVHGWAVGEKGMLIATDDGGHHWEQYEQFTDNPLRSIVICPNGDLLVAGDNGTLYRITP